ncbi:MAG: RNA methyltransferase [Spirochaetia bacterium]|jgi:TrmH RNA methyltransferase|nr:RNA methyltransferase [Spirochaetia bacterium]
MKNQQRGEMAVCGFESVMALAKSRAELIQRFFYLPERARDFGFLCSALAASRKAYRIVTAAELEKLSGTVHHQGVVAMIRNDDPPRVDDALVLRWAAAGRRIVVMDRVGDDHNFGSIARSAAFFGWDAIVTGDDDGSARLTTSAYRVARGALSRIAVYRDESAAVFVRRCSGVLTTVGADHRATNEIRNFAAQGIVPALALVLGNEETGLSEPVRKSCDSLVRIGGSGTVESLNVSQAAAVLLYELGSHGPDDSRSG